MELSETLLLLGVVHGDPQGFARLTAFLHRFNPETIFVEISPFGLLWRIKNGVSLQKQLRDNLRQAAGRLGIAMETALRRPHITAIRRQIAVPFEYRAALRFGLISGARPVPVDDSSYSRKLIAWWPELLSEENLVHLLELQNEPVSVAREYKRAIRGLSGEKMIGGFFLPEDDEWEALEKRERLMASKIMRVQQSVQPRRALWIGGWKHLMNVGTIPTLRDLLRISQSRCMILDNPPDDLKISGIDSHIAISTKTDIVHQ